MIEKLRQRDPAAVAELYDGYAEHVLRVLASILGAGDSELMDVHHTAFVNALRSLQTVRDPGALKGWLTIIAVNTARTTLKRRQAKSWLRLMSWYEVPEVAAPALSEEAATAVRRVFEVLDKLPPCQRIAFSLRYIEGMTLPEVARCCSVSLATIKRHLAKAEKRFALLARRDPALAPWLKEGTRWD